MSNFGGKGSNPRPCDKDKYDSEFDRIFGKKKKDKEECKKIKK